MWDGEGEGIHEGGKAGIESERIQNRNGSENKKIKKPKKSRPHQTKAILYSSSFPLGKEPCAERGLASRGSARGKEDSSQGAASHSGWGWGSLARLRAVLTTRIKWRVLTAAQAIN